MDRELLDRRAAIERERAATGAHRAARRMDASIRASWTALPDLRRETSGPRPGRRRPPTSPPGGTPRRSAAPPRTSSSSSPRPVATPGCWRSSPTPGARCCGIGAPRPSAGPAERVGLVPGGRWDETAAGTNGIGMALVTGRPVAVFATEHWYEPVRDWVCYSAPVQRAGRLRGRRHRPEHDVGPGQPARPAHDRHARPPDGGRAGSASWSRFVAAGGLDVHGLGRGRVTLDGRAVAAQPVGSSSWS